MQLTQSGTTKPSLFLYIILGAIGALTPFAIDMYLPAMPVIAEDLAVPASAVQITLTAYSIGFALAQMIHGPLSDSLGRKPVMVVGTLLFGLGCALAANVHSIEMFIALRIVQGMAGAASAVVLQALVRDMFDREDFARTMSFVSLVVTVAPLVAPLVGGYLSLYLGWESIFYVLALLALIIVALVAFCLPETLSAEHRRPFELRATLAAYGALSRDMRVLCLVLCGAFSFAGMFAFLTAGSFVYITLYHIPPEHFGYYFALNIVVMMVITSINGRYVKKVGIPAMLRVGLGMQVLAGMGLVLVELLGLSYPFMVACIMIFVGNVALIGSNAMGLLMSDFPQMAGTVAAVAGTLRFALAGIVGACVSMLSHYGAMPMAVAMCLCGVGSWATFHYASRHLAESSADA